jgi:hypothetical protein
MGLSVPLSSGEQSLIASTKIHFIMGHFQPKVEKFEMLYFRRSNFDTELLSYTPIDPQSTVMSVFLFRFDYSLWAQKSNRQRGQDAKKLFQNKHKIFKFLEFFLIFINEFGGTSVKKVQKRVENLENWVPKLL